MNYGHFDDENREYVITRPDTPLPWINYLGSEAYFGLISNTAGGYSLLPRRPAAPPDPLPLQQRPPGHRRALPLPAGRRQRREFWSPTWQPTRSHAGRLCCRHGLGYTIIGSEAQGIEARPATSCPWTPTWRSGRPTVTNQRAEAADLSLFSAVEFSLWDAWDDETNFQRNFNTGEVEVDEDGGIIYHKTEYRERRDHFAYLCLLRDTGRLRHPAGGLPGAYRGWDSPLAVERGRSANSLAHGWSPIGSHHVRLHLAAGREPPDHLPAGLSREPPGRQVRSARLPDHQQGDGQAHHRSATWTRAVADAAFDALADHWDGCWASSRCETPDEHTNRMVNIWNAYQCMVTFNLSRSASYFESGVGRGMGFRDSNQDLLGFVHMVPDRARERILDLAATQLENGGAYHQYQPLTKRGNDAVGSNFNDDPLWLVLAAAAYLQGDRRLVASWTSRWSTRTEPGTRAALHASTCSGPPSTPWTAWGRTACR